MRPQSTYPKRLSRMVYHPCSNCRLLAREPFQGPFHRLRSGIEFMRPWRRSLCIPRSKSWAAVAKRSWRAMGSPCYKLRNSIHETRKQTHRHRASHCRRPIAAFGNPMATANAPITGACSRPRFCLYTITRRTSGIRHDARTLPGLTRPR